MQDALKAVWSIPHVSVAFFASLKYNFIAYRSSKVSSSPDCIFEIHQQWQLGFSRVYSNSCCSCSFEPEILKIGQSSHKMYSNNIVNFQESTTILNACTKNSLKAPRIFQQFFFCLKKAIRALLFPNFWEKQDFFFLTDLIPDEDWKNRSTETMCLRRRYLNSRTKYVCDFSQSGDQWSRFVYPLSSLCSKILYA